MSRRSERATPRHTPRRKRRHEHPAADAQQRTAGERLPARAAAREHGTARPSPPRRRAAIAGATRTRVRGAALDREPYAARELRRDPAADARRRRSRRRASRARSAARVEMIGEEEIALRRGGRHAAHRCARPRWRTRRWRPVRVPTKTNAASSTSPSATPARYGSAYGSGARRDAEALIASPLRRRRGFRPADRCGVPTPGTSRRTAGPDVRACAPRRAPRWPAGRCGSTRRLCRAGSTPAFAEQPLPAARADS